MKRREGARHRSIRFCKSNRPCNQSRLTEGHHAREPPDGRVELLDAAHELVPCVDVHPGVLVGHASRGARGGRAGVARSRSKSSARDCWRRCRRHHPSSTAAEQPAAGLLPTVAPFFLFSFALVRTPDKEGLAGRGERESRRSAFGSLESARETKRRRDSSQGDDRNEEPRQVPRP